MKIRNVKDFKRSKDDPEVPRTSKSRKRKKPFAIQCKLKDSVIPFTALTNNHWVTSARYETAERALAALDDLVDKDRRKKTAAVYDYRVIDDKKNVLVEVVFEEEGRE